MKHSLVTMLSSSNRTQSFNYSVKAPWQVLVQDHGVESRNIMFLNLVCCPEGLKAMAQAYPEIHIITGRRHIKSISISDQYLFIEPGSGQKSQSGSRRPLNPDPNPSYFLTLSKDNIKLFNNYKIFSSKGANWKIPEYCWKRKTLGWFNNKDIF